MTRPLLEMTIDELRDALVQDGHKAFRTKQLADWVYKKGVVEAGLMSNIPPSLVESHPVLTSRVVDRTDCDDGCIKLLVELHDGEHIEAVLIPTSQRASACVSTQVGCAMGCAFCASGLDGLVRNLTSGEILEQVLHLQIACERKITNVVFMGIGEPLANYDATVAAVRALIDPERFGISARRITVSTVGLPEQIDKLAREDLPITLAISLHAPNDVIRSKLIPATKRFPLADVLAAAETFYASRKREVTLEYSLLAGVNDSLLCADALAKIASRLRCNVNLIQYNPVPSLPYARPTRQVVEAFATRLSDRGANVTIRRSRGLHADAACGQLRQRAQSNQSRSNPPR